jgi:hypothetical protein
MERESTKVRISQKLAKKEETLIEKIKRSLDERHTKTHRSLTDTFRQNHRYLFQSEEIKCT